MDTQGRQNVALHCRVGNVIAQPQLQRFWEVVLRLSMTGLGYHNYAPQLNGEDQFMKDWLKKNPGPITMVDVGAHQGEFTDIVLANHSQPTIYAFEPNPKSYARLRRKYDDNSKVTLSNLAVSDSQGIAEIYDKADSEGTCEATFLPQSLGRMKCDRATVQTIPLDIYCAEHGIAAIDYLKVDVEGFEPNVFRGAAGLLVQKQIGIIHFEMNFHSVMTGFSLYAAMNLLPGYTIYRILPRGLVEVAGPHVQYRHSHDFSRHHNLVASAKPLW